MLPYISPMELLQPFFDPQSRGHTPYMRSIWEKHTQRQCFNQPKLAVSNLVVDVDPMKPFLSA